MKKKNFNKKRSNNVKIDFKLHLVISLNVLMYTALISVNTKGFRCKKVSEKLDLTQSNRERKKIQTYYLQFAKISRINILKACQNFSTSPMSSDERKISGRRCTKTKTYNEMSAYSDVIVHSHYHYAL